MDELLSDERLPELPYDFPLKAAPLLPLPLLLLNERDERSEVGTWTDWLLRPLELRDEPLLEDGRDCPEELPDDMLREEDDPLLPLLLDDRRP